MEIVLKVKEIINREVKGHMDSGRLTAGYLYLPKAWVGKVVKVVLEDEGCK